MYNPVGSPRLRTASPINRARINSHLRLPSYGSPYGLGGLSRRDRQGQSVPPCFLVLLMQRSPRRVSRPTSATCGYAQTRRGWQQAERAAAWLLAGVPAATQALQSFYFSCKGSKPAATQGLPRATMSASLRRMVPPRLFLSPPSFFFTHEKERRGAGGSQPQSARGVVLGFPYGKPAYLHQAR